MSDDTIEIVSSPSETIIVSMEVDRQSSHTVEATNDGLSDPEWERRDPPSPMRHTTWTSNITAMAKCDYCERGSRGTLQQCHDCSRAICQECFDAGKLIHPHQLDAERVDWNQHNKSGRSSKKRASRARPRFDSSSATAPVGTSASPHSQERQFGGVVPPDTASPSSSVPPTPEIPSIREMFNRPPRYELCGSATVGNHYGNNGYAPIEPQPSSGIEQAEKQNNWNFTFSQPPGRYRGHLNGSSNVVALADSEDPFSWNGTFGRRPVQRRQDHQGSSAYHGSASATAEDTSSWNIMIRQPRIERRNDQMQTFQNSAASANNGEWRQSYQSSSAYDVNQPAHHDQQEPAANLLLRSHRDLSSSWQPRAAPYPSAARSIMYDPDLLNYCPIPIAVAPAAFPQSSRRVSSTPRVLPERIMPRFLSLDAPWSKPSGPPRRYEDYLDLHSAKTASSQGQSEDRPI